MKIYFTINEHKMPVFSLWMLNSIISGHKEWNKQRNQILNLGKILRSFICTYYLTLLLLWISASDNPDENPLGHLHSNSFDFYHEELSKENHKLIELVFPDCWIQVGILDSAQTVANFYLNHQPENYYGNDTTKNESFWITKLQKNFDEIFLN